MLFKKKAFTLTIGNANALLTLYNNKFVETKVLVPVLAAEDKVELLKIFEKHKYAPITIILDNIEQTYTNKSYPNISRGDLKQVITRQIKQEFSLSGSDDIFFNHIIRRNKIKHLWECMYISSTYFEELEKWINFLMEEVNNSISGIYFLPIESYNLLKKIRKAEEAKGKKAKPDKKTQEVEKVTLLIMQNKVSGIREVVFHHDKMIFTRVANYDYEHKNFITDFEQDIFRTNEYLKRIIPTLKIENIEIINILPRTVLEKITHIKNNELKFTNYTPREIAEKIGCSNMVAKNSQFSDLLISGVILTSKKILKFSTKKFRSLSIVNFISRAFVTLIGALFIFLIGYFAFIQFEQISNGNKIEELRISKNASEKGLEYTSKQIIGDQMTRDDGTKLDLDEIIDFGKLDEAMSKNNVNINEFYKKINFFSDKKALVKNIKIDNKFIVESGQNSFTFTISGKLTNESGNVEDLFNSYDQILLETNKNFPNTQVSGSEMPKDIDFTKQYFETPFTINIRAN